MINQRKRLNTQIHRRYRLNAQDTPEKYSKHIGYTREIDLEQDTLEKQTKYTGYNGEKD